MKVAMCSNRDDGVWLFRRGLAIALIARGAEVTNLTPAGPYVSSLKELGAKHFEVPFCLYNGPLRDLQVCFTLYCALRRHASLYRLAVPTIWRGAENALDRFSRRRGTMRLMSGHELSRARGDARAGLILVDEGNLGCAHALFAFPHRELLPDPNAIRAYARAASAPDLVIHVDAPLPVLLERTRKRSLKPVHGRHCDDRFARFLSGARFTFRMLAADDTFRGRVLTVVNAEDSPESIRRLTDRIVRFVLSHGR